MAWIDNKLLEFFFLLFHACELYYSIHPAFALSFLTWKRAISHFRVQGVRRISQSLTFSLNHWLYYWTINLTLPENSHYVFPWQVILLVLTHIILFLRPEPTRGITTSAPAPSGILGCGTQLENKPRKKRRALGIGHLNITRLYCHEQVNLQLNYSVIGIN